MASHKHNYQEVRRTKGKDGNGKTVTYIFLECLNPGCPAPNQMQVQR